MARVIHAVHVEIKGELDPSLARAVGMTEAEFKRLEKACDTFNALDKLGVSTTGIGPINLTINITGAGAEACKQIQAASLRAQETM